MADEAEFTRNSKPLTGVVLCFTSISHDTRSDLCNKAAEMGGSWKQDLTSDTTHLIVGDSNTPKYKYVARQRPDVLVLGTDFIAAVHSLWIKGEDVVLSGLELKYKFPTLKGFSICGTNLSEDERKKLAALAPEHGGKYSGDLTKTITHLIAAVPKGKKYEYARGWGIKIVSPEWLHDSLRRGLALDEALYNPELPVHERGKGAFVKPKPGKRKSTVANDEADALSVTSISVPITASGGGGGGGGMNTGPQVDASRRKIRKTASMKLGSQSLGLWEDIISQGQAQKPTKRDEWEDGNPLVQKDASDKKKDKALDPNIASEKAPAAENPIVKKSVAERPQPIVKESNRGIFADMSFHVHGFDFEKAQTLRTVVQQRGGDVYPTVPALLSSTGSRYFVVVPASLPIGECPKVSDSSRAVQIAKFWWIERCMHTNTFTDPDDHVLFRPFKTLPIADFLHLSKAIKETGAAWHDEFTRKTSVLVVNTEKLGQQSDKIDAAIEWKVPIVSENWFFESISEGHSLSFEKYFLPKEISSKKWGVGDTNYLNTTTNVADLAEAKAKPLDGCVLWVSSNHNKNPSKLEALAFSLGAEIHEHKDKDRKKPTHFILTDASANDSSPDLKIAKANPQCFFVTPEWIIKCKTDNRRVEEKEYMVGSDAITPRKAPKIDAFVPSRKDDDGPFIIEQDEPIAERNINVETGVDNPIKARDVNPIISYATKANVKTPATIQEPVKQPIPTDNQITPEHNLRNPKIMQNLSEILKMQQASAMNKPKKLRGRLQGRAMSNNSLPVAPDLSRVSSEQSSLDDGSFRTAEGDSSRRPSLGLEGSFPIAVNGNKSNIDDGEDSLLDIGMQGTGVLGSQAIHYDDPEAQLEKKKLMEKLSIKNNDDKLLKGRTLSMVTAAAEDLDPNPRKRTTRRNAR